MEASKLAFRILAIVLAGALAAVLDDGPARAQDPIEISIDITQPVPPYIEGWRDRIFVTLRVAPGAPQDAYDVVLLGNVEHLSLTDVFIRTISPSSPVSVDRGFDRVLTGAEIGELFDPDEVEASGGLDPEELTVSDRGLRVPEGSYHICVEALDVQTETMRQGFQCSTPFQVRYVDPPRLILPEDNATLTTVEGGDLMPPFQWENYETFGVPLDYEFRMVEVPEGVLPDDALRDGSLFQFRSLEMSPFIFAPDDHPSFPMTAGRRYAWQVIASDPTGTVHISEGGESEVRSFVYGAFEAELSVMADVGSVTFSPARPDQTIPIRVRLFSSGGAGTEITTLRTARIMILDGMRIVHDSEDAPMDPLPVTFTTWVTANVNVTLPPSVVDAILGSRDAGRFTMQIHVNADPPTPGGDPISGYGEIDANIVRADLIATMTRPAAMPVRVDLSHPRVPLEFEFRNATPVPVTLSRLRQVWRFDEGSVMTVEDDITDSGSTVTVPSSGSTTFFTGVNIDTDVISRYYSDEFGFITGDGDITIEFTFMSTDGSVEVPASPPLDVMWSNATIIDTVTVSVSAPPQPHRYFGQFNGPELTFSFSNPGRVDVTFDEWTREVYSSSGTFVGRVNERLPRSILVPAGGVGVWQYRERSGYGAHQLMRTAASGSSRDVAFEIDYQFEGAEARGNRYFAGTDPRIDAVFSPNALSTRALDPVSPRPVRSGDLVFTPSDTQLPVDIEFTNHTGAPLRVSEIRRRISDPFGGALLLDLGSTPFDRTFSPGDPVVVDDLDWLEITPETQASLFAATDSRWSRDYTYEMTFPYVDPATGRGSESTAEFPITIRTERDGLGVTARPEGGLPARFSTGHYSLPVEYDFMNHREYDLQFRSAEMTLLRPGGEVVLSSDTLDISAAPGPIPAGGSFTLDYFFGFGEPFFDPIQRGGSFEGEILTASVYFLAEDRHGTAYPALATFDVMLGGVLSVEASAEGGFPVRLATGDPSVPVTYTFTNSGDSDISLIQTNIETYDRSGAEMSNELFGHDEPIVVPAGGSVSRVSRFGLSTEAIERRRSDDAAEVYRARVRFEGRNEAGALQAATTEFNFVILASDLEVTATAADGLPLQFYPGVDRRAVTYELHNHAGRPLTVTWFQTLVSELDGTEIQALPRTEIGSGPVRLGPDSTHSMNIDFGFTDAGWRSVRAGGDRRVEVEATFTAVDEAGEEVSGSAHFDAQIRLSPLRVTAEAPWGFPLTLYAGTDRADITYTYHNDGDTDLEIVGVTQRVLELDGSGGPGTPSAFSSPIRVPAGGSVSDPRFFGIGASSLAAHRASIPAGEHIKRLRAELLFTARDPSGSGFDTPFSFDLNISNSSVRVRAEVPGGAPLTFVPGDTRKPVVYHFQNFDSAPHDFAELTQSVSDDRGTLVSAPASFPRRPGPLEIPASGTAQDSVPIIPEPTFFDAARSEGRDASFTYLAQFSEAVGEPPYAETQVPLLVASSISAASAPFTAASPADGTVVRGPVHFEIASRDSIHFARDLVSVYLQVYRIPSGAGDVAGAMIPANRVAERTFDPAGTTHPIRWDAEARRLKLLHTKASRPADDRWYEFNGNPDTDYVWTADIVMMDRTGPSPDTTRFEMERARFTTREAIAECGAECTLTPPAGSGERSRSATSYVGTTVTIGAFDLEITSATGNGAALNGEGHIDVPYLNAPIAVEFSSLAINSLNEVVSGEAKAKTDRPDLLTPDYTDRVTDMSESMSITEDQAEDFQEIAEAVESTGRIISAFTGSREPVQLPLGIDQHIDGEFLLLAVIGIKFKPTGARVNAVLSVPLPELDTRLAVGARGICLTAAGFDEEITFYLASDLFLTMSELDAGFDDYTIRFKAGATDASGTWMRWRCGNMEVLRLEMWHEFPRDWITPIDPATGELVADSTVKSTAKLVVDIRPAGTGSGGGTGGGGSGTGSGSGSGTGSGGGSGGGSGSGSGSGSGTAGDTTVTSATGLQWIAGVREFTPSAISDANGFWFSVESMYYDNSSTANPSGMTFPAGYPSSLQNSRWTGFYLGLVRLNLPDEIRSYGEENNIELQVRHLLVDNTGLSFTVAVRNLLTLKSDTTGSSGSAGGAGAGSGSDGDCVATLEGGTDSCVGDLGGWQFSVDELSVSVLHSSFGMANLNGRFKIPISDTALVYSATLARPASLRMGDGSGSGSGSGGSGSGGGGSGPSDPGSSAASAFGMACASLLADRPASGSGSGSGGGSSGGGGSGGGASGSSSTSGEPPDLIFEMLVHPAGDVKADIWGAELTIGASSKICVGNQTGELRAGAEINGRFGLAESEGLPAEITGVPFERIRVMTFAPYFEAPDFARTSREGGGESADDSDSDADPEGEHSSEGEGLAIDIANIGLEFEAALAGSDGRTGIDVGLGFDVSLRLPGDGAFRASARDIVIWGRVRLATEDDPADFQFIGFKTVPTFCVGGDAEALKIDGCIQVYVDRPDPRGSDATDTGVAGAIRAVIAQQFTVQVAAEFGVRSQGDTEFEYFFVDAAVTFESGINVGGAVALYGILGGIWYNMEGPPGFSDAESSDFGEVLSQPASTAEPSVEGVLYKYRPVTTGEIGTWGFKAGLVLGVAGNAEAFNIDVFVEAEISGAGNLNYIRLVGDAYVMTKLSDRSDPKIRGTLVIELAFRPATRPDGTEYREAVFDASFTLVGNLADILRLNGQAGFHVEEAYWQFYIGRPPRDERFRVRLTLGGADLLSLSTYIMMGERLPPYPPPPEGAPRVEAHEVHAIREAAGGTPGVDENGDPIQNISGFMMGADLRIEPSLDLGIIGLDGYFQLGFDVAILQTLPYIRCRHPETGILFNRGDNGWYIEGRMYAMMGIKLWTRALFGIKATIARLDAGITLEGGFPNPEYFAGAAEVSGELLGAIRFDEHVEFTIGDKCEIAPPSPLEGIELITDLRPSDADPHFDRDVSPFADPTAAFFLDLNETVALTDEADRLRYFRLRSPGLEIEDAETGEDVACRIMVRRGGAFEVCEPVVPGTRTPSHLEPETRYSVTAEVVAEERMPGGWSQALTLEGDPISEEKRASFRTGCLPSELDGLVLQTYPINGQRYFLTDETSFGFVDVAVNVDYMRRSGGECASTRSPTADAAGEGYEFLVRFTPFPTGEPIEVDATLISQRFSFTIPPLESETVYAAQLIRKEPENISSPDPFRLLAEYERRTTVTADMREEMRARLLETFERSGPALIRRRVINAFSTSRPNEQRLYHWVFRTSRFGTLQEKMAGASFGTPEYRRAFAFLFEVNTLRVPLELPEPFDDVDIYGRNYEVNVTDYTGSGTYVGQTRAAVSTTTSPRLFSQWRSSSDNYLRYAGEDVYPAEALLRRHGRIVGYPPSRGRPNGREMMPLVFLSSRSRQPLLPDDPEALTDLLVRETRTTSGAVAGGPALGLIAQSAIQTSLAFPVSTLRLSPAVQLAFATPPYRLEYNVGTAVSHDWAMMRSYGPRLVARRPQVCVDRSGSRCYRYAPVDLRLLQQKMVLPFRPYSRGTYPVEFQYFPFIVDEFHPGRSTRPPFVKTFRY